MLQKTGQMAGESLSSRARAKALGFEVPPYDDAVGVGSIGVDWVSVWARASAPGMHRVDFYDAATGRRKHFRFKTPPSVRGDGIASVRCPLPVSAGGGPACFRYQVVRERDDFVLGAGQFETAPVSEETAPDEFSFLVVSCHQPFDDEGRVIQKSLRMLRALETVVEEQKVKAALMIGDQMYADMPESLSLLKEDYFRAVGPDGKASIMQCTAEEVRALYGERYRVFGNVGPWRRLRELLPCYMMHDDHELFDNFGASPKHVTEEYSAFREGALQASFDYQGRHHWCGAGARPSSMHHTFEYGPFACFLMDIRSQKRAIGEEVSFFDEEQARALERYLDAQHHRAVVAVVCTVPLVFLPDWLASAADYMTSEASDAGDRWAHQRAKKSRNRLLDILHRHQQRHPDQKLVLLGGDVHVGLAHRLTWRASGLQAVQMISSGVSNTEGKLKLEAARLLPKLTAPFSIGEGPLELRCDMLDGDGNNPQGSLNAGLLSFRREEGEWVVRIKLLSNSDKQDPEAYVAYESCSI